MLRNAGRYLAKDPGRGDVLSVFAGQRPLVRGDDSDTKKISREHAVVVSNSGLVTIVGGKWTTYRKMAEDALVDAIAVGGLPARPCVTETLHLHGSARARRPRVPRRLRAARVRLGPRGDRRDRAREPEPRAAAAPAPALHGRADRVRRAPRDGAQRRGRARAPHARAAARRARRERDRAARREPARGRARARRGVGGRAGRRRSARSRAGICSMADAHAPFGAPTRVARGDLWGAIARRSGAARSSRRARADRDRDVPRARRRDPVRGARRERARGAPAPARRAQRRPQRQSVPARRPRAGRGRDR